MCSTFVDKYQPISNHHHMIEQVECLICFEKKQKENQYKYPNCDHAFCYGCLQTMFEQKIKEQKVQLDNFSCPQCQSLLSDRSCIEKLVTKNAYNQYCEMLIMQNLIELEDDEILVDCKNELCTNKFMIWKDADYQKCQVCLQVHCRKCNSAHKIGIFCEQGLILQQQSYIEKKKNLNISRCPNCKVLVQKTFGCNFMTCKCGTYFCYKCDQQLTKEDHLRHYQQNNPSNKCRFLLNGQWVDSVPNEQKKKKPFKIISERNYIPCQTCNGYTETLIDFLFYQCNSKKCKSLCYCLKCKKAMSLKEVERHIEYQCQLK